STAVACPVCNTSTGAAVRAGIFDGGFAWNVLATLLPFVALLPVVTLLHFGLPGRRRSNEDQVP
ncbi:MAG TPA: hypothetical protein VF595_15990, partial [Tepidisphaeraceae bacterium]